MRRLVSACLALLLVIAMAPAVGAHTLVVTGAWSLKGDQLSVKVTDPYGAAVEGGAVTGAAVQPGAKAGKGLPLKETQPGIYTGTIAAPSTDTYDIIVEITVAQQLFRGSLRVKAGTDLAETLVPMLPIDPPASPWGPILYGAAALVLIVATAIALLRRRDSEEEVG